MTTVLLSLLPCHGRCLLSLLPCRDYCVAVMSLPCCYSIVAMFDHCVVATVSLVSRWLCCMWTLLATIAILHCFHSCCCHCTVVFIALLYMYCVAATVTVVTLLLLLLLFIAIQALLDVRSSVVALYFFFTRKRINKDNLTNRVVACCSDLLSQVEFLSSISKWMLLNIWWKQLSKTLGDALFYPETPVWLPGGGILPYSFGGGVPLGSRKSYPLLDQILQILWPYARPKMFDCSWFRSFVSDPVKWDLH